MFFLICLGIIAVCFTTCLFLRGSKGAGIGTGVAWLSLVIALATTTVMSMGFSQWLLHSNLPLAEHIALGFAFTVGSTVAWVWGKLFH